MNFLFFLRPWKQLFWKHLEWPNVERPIFRNFETSNIKITKNELIDFSFSNLFFHSFKLFKHSTFWWFSQSWNIQNLLIFKTVEFGKLASFANWKFVGFSNLEIYEILLIEKSTNFQDFTICKISQFWNCSFIWYSTPIAILPILILVLCYKLISIYLLSILVTLINSNSPS